MAFDVECFAALKGGAKAWKEFRNSRPDSPPSLAGIDLSSEDTAGPFLWEADLERVKLLKDFDFENVRFDDSNLSKVKFVEANLKGASFKGCDLSGADLEDAKLFGSSWKGAKLTTTELDWQSFVPEATRKLPKAILKEEVDAENPKNTKDRAELYDDAKDGWRRLKNNWLEMGKYDDASQAARREKRAERKAARCQKKGGLVFVSWLADLLCEYGENPSRILCWGVGIIFACPVVYSVQGIEEAKTKVLWQISFSCGSESLEGFWKFLYFSVTTFTAAGSGDFVPHGWLSQAVAALESIAGLVLSALFVWTLSRRMSPR